MKNKFSKEWKKSKKPRKQRKYRYNAPLHTKRKFIRAHLSKDLRKKYGRRNIGLRKGDKVIVMRGKFKKHTGKIDFVDIKESKAYITGIDMTKKDGTKTTLPIDPSNLMIMELNIDDKMREKILRRKQ